MPAAVPWVHEAYSSGYRWQWRRRGGGPAGDSDDHHRHLERGKMSWDVYWDNHGLCFGVKAREQRNLGKKLKSSHPNVDHVLILIKFVARTHVYIQL